MLEYRWVRTWWEIHRRDCRLLIVIAVDDAGQPIGLAPLYLRRDTRDPVRLLRTVHFLGTGEREADEIASEYLGWLGPPKVIDTMTALVGQVLRDHADD